jgi:rod shape-determining protein MreC
VLTSGGDQVYPRGLPVGTIQSIAPDPDHQPYSAIVVRPAVNLDRLEEVLVITGTQTDLPPGTQQDLAAAETQHAADISAERLPGLHDDEPATAAGAANAAAVGAPNAPAIPSVVAVPHPLPALHPDRFSNGVTPPANELTPGGQNSHPAASPQESMDSSDPKATKPTAQPASPN